MKNLTRTAVTMVALSFALQTTYLHGVILISNVNGNDGAVTSSFTSGRNKGMGFTMPGATTYQLDNVTLRLNVPSGAASFIHPIVQIWSNTASNFPGSSLVTLIDPSFTSSFGVANYPFTPPSAFALLPATTYWVVVSDSNTNDFGFDWEASSPAVTPTGLATHFGQFFDQDGTPPTGPSTTLNSYSLSATLLPEPASGVLVLFGLTSLLARRRARR